MGVQAMAAVQVSAALSRPQAALARSPAALLGRQGASAALYTARTSPRQRRQLVAPAQAFLNLKMPFGSTSSASSTAAAKEELLEAIKPLKRGLTASEEDQQRIDRLARALERRNPTKKPLASDLLSGQWELLYTTSGSILGASRPALLRPTGPTYQVLDTETLTARNKEGPPFFNQVSADLIPQNDRTVKVQFKEFKILGLIPVKAPASAAGVLETTYLDEELRISRGDRGNLFVLRMQNRRVKP